MTGAYPAVLAGLMCAWLGLRSGMRLRQEAARLKRWTELTAALALLLAEGTLPLPAALRCAADAPGPADDLLRAVADQVEAVPLTSLHEAFAALCPDCPERAALDRLFRRLGRGSAESRRLASLQAGDALSVLAASAAEKAGRDAKLFFTLGWTGGATLTLLLL